MLRRLVLFSVVLVVVAGQVGMAEARPQRPPLVPPLECGSLPTTDVRLPADLSCTVPFTRMVDGYPTTFDPDAAKQLITIDLAGHTLDITGIAVPCMPYYPFPERCGIVGPYRFVDGTILGNVGTVAQLDHVTVHGSVFINHFSPAEPDREVSIRHSAIVDGRVSVRAAATIEQNVLVRSGIDTNDNQAGVLLVVRRNILVDSPEAAIWLIVSSTVKDDISATVTDNLIIGAGGPGIFVQGIEYALGRVDLHGNIVWAGHDDGIRVWIRNAFGPPDQLPPIEGGPVTITANLAVGNAGHGIGVDLFDPTRSFIVDGGANRAVGNGVEPACTIVVCA